jgi:endonuclease-3
VEPIVSEGPECDLEEMIDRLRNKYMIQIEDFLAPLVWERSRDAFKVLVATLLTQNSTDKSAMVAFENLEKEIGISPDKLANASIEEIAKAIRPAGLHNNKAKNIREISKIIHESFHDLLEDILNQSPDKAREILVSMPGIGTKTADVVLLICKGYRTFPVDTHIFRISRRLGIEGRNYSEISSVWVRHVKDPLNAHLLLITHGRKTCKAVKPKCQECVLIDCCQYYLGVLRSERHDTTRGRSAK